MRKKRFEVNVMSAEINLGNKHGFEDVTIHFQLNLGSYITFTDPRKHITYVVTRFYVFKNFPYFYSKILPKLKKNQFISTSLAEIVTNVASWKQSAFELKVEDANKENPWTKVMVDLNKEAQKVIDQIENKSK